MKLSSIHKASTGSYVFLSAALLLFCSLPAVAQDQDEPPPRPKAEIRLTGGASGFTGDDGEIPHGVAGGSFRVYVTRRVSIEPEFLYMTNNPNDRDYLAQVSVAYDFGDSGNDSCRMWLPALVSCVIAVSSLAQTSTRGSLAFSTRHTLRWRSAPVVA